MNKENTDQEIDLGYLYKSFSNFMTKIGLGFYNFLMFLKKYALIIIGIIAIGGVIGYFLDKNNNVLLRHDIIVVPNFESVYYIYETLPKYSFIDEVNLISDPSIQNTINRIEIKPVENIYSLFKNNKDVMLPMFKVIRETGGNVTDLGKAESITKNYKYHMISIYTSNTANQTEVVDKVFEKLNSNSYYIEKQKIAKVQNQIKKDEIEKSLQQVNEILNSLGKGERLLDSKAVSINTFSETDDIFSRKNLILNELSTIKEDILMQDNIVYITNRIMNNYVDLTFWEKKIITIPLSLLSLFLITIMLLNFTKKFKAIKEKDLN